MIMMMISFMEMTMRVKEYTNLANDGVYDDCPRQFSPKLAPSFQSAVHGHLLLGQVL
jgi:hypothetical protein